MNFQNAFFEYSQKMIKDCVPYTIITHSCNNILSFVIIFFSMNTFMEKQGEALALPTRLGGLL